MNAMESLIKFTNQRINTKKCLLGVDTQYSSYGYNHMIWWKAYYSLYHITIS